MRAGQNEFWNRRGIFFLDINVLWRGSWEDLSAIFDGLVILESRSNFATGQAEYWAISEAFDEVPEGQVWPEYECRIDYLDDGSRRVRWLRDGIEPEPEAPEPINLRLPNLRRINLAVADVLHRFRDNSDLFIDVDEWIASRDWSNPFLETDDIRASKAEIERTVAGYLGGDVSMCYTQPLLRHSGVLDELVLCNGDKRWTFRVDCRVVDVELLVDWVRWKWKAEDLKRGGDRVLIGTRTANEWRKRMADDARRLGSLGMASLGLFGMRPDLAAQGGAFHE